MERKQPRSRNSHFAETEKGHFADWISPILTKSKPPRRRTISWATEPPRNSNSTGCLRRPSTTQFRAYHYGTKHFFEMSNHSLPHKLGSEWASERMSAAERMSKTSSAEQLNKWMVRANKQKNEWMAHYLCIDSWLFWTTAQWFRSAMNWVVSTGPLTRQFAHSLPPLTYLLAPHCSFCLRTLLCSFICSLTPTQAHGKVNGLMSQNQAVLNLSAQWYFAQWYFAAFCSIRNQTLYW